MASVQEVVFAALGLVRECLNKHNQGGLAFAIGK